MKQPGQAAGGRNKGVSSAQATCGARDQKRGGCLFRRRRGTLDPASPS